MSILNEVSTKFLFDPNRERVRNADDIVPIDRSKDPTPLVLDFSNPHEVTGMPFVPLLHRHLTSNPVSYATIVLGRYAGYALSVERLAHEVRDLGSHVYAENLSPSLRVAKNNGSLNVVTGRKVLNSVQEGNNRALYYLDAEVTIIQQNGEITSPADLKNMPVVSTASLEDQYDEMTEEEASHGVVSIVVEKERKTPGILYLSSRLSHGRLLRGDSATIRAADYTLLKSLMENSFHSIDALFEKRKYKMETFDQFKARLTALGANLSPLRLGVWTSQADGEQEVCGLGWKVEEKVLIPGREVVLPSPVQEAPSSLE